MQCVWQPPLLPSRPRVLPCPCRRPARHPTDKTTGASAGYGFVKFAERKPADAALQALNGKVYLGHELRVNWAFQSHQKEDTSHHHHIFVGDLGQEVTDALLYNAFCQAGSCS